MNFFRGVEVSTNWDKEKEPKKIEQDVYNLESALQTLIENSQKHLGIIYPELIQMSLKLDEFRGRI